MQPDTLPLLGLILCGLGLLILAARFLIWPACPPSLLSVGLVLFFGSPVLFLPPAAKFLVGLPLWVLLAVYFNFRYKSGQAQMVRQRIEGPLRAHGVEFLEENTYRLGKTVFTFDVDPGPLFVRNLKWRVAVYTDSFYEWVVKRAMNVAEVSGQKLASDPFYRDYLVEGMLYPEVWEYLQAEPVRGTMTSILPGRWRACSQRYVERVLYDNEFDAYTYSVDDLLRDVAGLRRLAEVPLIRKYGGGTCTFRFGFEPDMPAWHWKPEERAALPPGIHRSLFSWYHDTPLLNRPLADVLYALGRDCVFCWITTGDDPEFLHHAFGDCFEWMPPFVVTRHPLAPVAADHVSDGRFFQGVIVMPQDRLPDLDAFRNCRSHEYHRAAVSLLDRVHFYARRLFDDEHSWYSGEIEVLSLKVGPEAVEAAVQDAARSYQAGFRRIEGMFSYKILREE